jgi:hypothetical protein
MGQGENLKTAGVRQHRARPIHEYGFFSLFDSQYLVLLDVLGDLSDVILVCGVFVEI